MPPKKKENAPKNKVVVDKTFGMKNKKGAKGQQQVKMIQQQEAQRGKNKEALAKEKEKEALAARKAAEAKKKAEVADLFNTVDIVQAKVPFGVDPKTVLCAFFKAGKCTKGSKCKYSHNLEQDRKTAKASIYADQRDTEKLEDTMDKWSEEKLQQVVLSKKGNQITTTDIVCKHFIDAIETGRYGWFWVCEQGDECKYRHALPPGFVLKSQKKKEEEEAKKREITLEEFLEVERHKLDPTKLTPLTKESFAEWKKNRVDRKVAQAQAEKEKKKELNNAGRRNGMSGRDLFTFNPDIAGDESEEEDNGAEEWDLEALRKKAEEEKEEEEKKRIADLEERFGSQSFE